MELEVFDYIERFYNRVRRHSSIGYRSAENFERTATDRKIAAQGLNGSGGRSLSVRAQLSSVLSHIHLAELRDERRRQDERKKRERGRGRIERQRHPESTPLLERAITLTGGILEGLYGSGPASG